MKNDNQVQPEEKKEKQKKDENNKGEESLGKKLEEFEDKYKRALADYQNLEKRVREERVEWIKASNKELLLRLLPVLDTLILASSHTQDQGLTIGIKQFEDALKDEGVARIETKGKEFNPHLMECVETQDGEDGNILSEVRAGYTIGDKVLRPAQVKVGKSS